MNRTMEDMLRHFVGPSGTDWDLHLLAVEFAINNAWQESVRNTPFFLNLHRHPRVPGQPVHVGNVPRSARVASEFQAVLSRAKASLRVAQDRQKAYADQHRRAASFSVGERVLLSTKNAQPKGVASKKLMPRWMGPFTITEVVNEVAVRLDLPVHLKWHNVFHVSLVKHYKDGGRVLPPPLPSIVDGEPMYEAEEVLSHRTSGSGKRRLVQYLIKWKGYGPQHNSWEPAPNILEHCGELVRSYLDKQGLDTADRGR